MDGHWFGFLRQTRDFANDATHTRLGAAKDALYYPAWVPYRVMGSALPLVPLGIVRTWRQQGARFTLVQLACLGFVSLTWVMRSSLGLDRHFVCIVPLYATFAAQGAAALADALARGTKSAALGRALAAPVTLLMLMGLYVQLDVWMGNWRGALEHGWPERAALGAYLRSLPGEPKVYCDDATLELLSGLDRRRFDRHRTDDPHTWDLVAEDAQRGRATADRNGEVYVATWRRKLEGHEDAGEIDVHRWRRSGAPHGDGRRRAARAIARDARPGKAAVTPASRRVRAPTPGAPGPGAPAASPRTPGSTARRPARSGGCGLAGAPRGVSPPRTASLSKKRRGAGMVVDDLQDAAVLLPHGRV